VIVALLLSLAAPAAAVEYELPLEIETEDDLYELLASGEITEETFDVLLELLRRGVDLARADAQELYALPSLTLEDVDRIVAYRAASGGILDPGALVAAGVLGDDKLAAIAPFVIVTSPAAPGLAVDGRVRYRTLYTTEDDRVPPMALEGRATLLRNLTGAVALLLGRNDVGDVRYDQGRDALSAAQRTTRLAVPKGYVMWKTEGLQAIAGSYTAGFGQRLTFDETALYTPNGIYPDAVVFRRTDLVRDCNESMGEPGAVPCDGAPRTYVSPDFDASERLFGLALSARKLPAGPGWLQLTGWGSAQLRDIYQYELYDRARCVDPTDDDDDDCRAPDVYVREGDPGEPAPRVSFTTLPDMWLELLGGANLSWFAARRAHVGVTGWGARPEWLIGGIDLDFQEYARFPRGGPYGAVGVDAAWGRSWADVGVEVTRSFDSVPGGGGGFGALARGTATWARSELELSLRYYDQDFVNPHTGAIAEPDEVDGQRARDEAGVRLRYAGKPTRRLSLRALANVWIAPSTETAKLRVEARADYTITRQIAAGLYARWSDKDLSVGGDMQCYDYATEEIEGELVPCKGQAIDAGALATLRPLRPLTLKLQGQLRVVDDTRTAGGGARQDLKAWAEARWWVTDALRVNARLRYDRPDLRDEIDAYLEESLWGHVQVTYRVPRRLMVSARYELRAYLNDEERSTPRDPSPEHWLGVEVEAKF
jgi:hypothetical protein